MDLYFSDVDTYITVNPQDFEDVILIDKEARPFLSELKKFADDLDSSGDYRLADLTDDMITRYAAKYQGKTVTLNKPFRTPGGPKKFSVYVKNDKGNVIKVNFGDPDMDIKRDDPKRRKSFRARHKCDSKKDKTTPGYWSCYQWRASKPVKD